MRGDVSFTFLHRVEEVEQNIEDERWQSALALALTLPDICGGIAFPEIVKRYRDGWIGRKTRPVMWAVNTYAGLMNMPERISNYLRQTRSPISAETAAGSFAVNICIRTKDF